MAKNQDKKYLNDLTVKGRRTNVFAIDAMLLIATLTWAESVKIIGKWPFLYWGWVVLSSLVRRRRLSVPHLHLSLVFCYFWKAEGSGLSTTTFMHHQHMINASSVRHQCVISASSVHHQCIISLSPVYHCIISASSARHQCIVSASSLHHQCIISESSVHQGSHSVSLTCQEQLF